MKTKNSNIQRALILSAGLLLFSFPVFAQETPQREVDAKEVHQLIDMLSKQLTDRYPFPELSAQYSKMLKANEKTYQHLDGDALAARLTKDLQEVHKDVHLTIYKQNAEMQAAIAEISEQESLERNGYGFKSVELDNRTSTAYINIPYGFNCTQAGFEMAGHAMNMAAYSKYVIIDVRDNGGGAGGMGHFLGSYFFEPGEEAFYLDGFEKNRKNLQEYTYGYVPGKRLTKSKLFILTNRGTGSASEGFALAMQKLGKATIVGDTTAGAGIAGIFVHLPADLTMFLPVKMLVAPGTTQGWEGTGVIPDVQTGDQDALEATRLMILRDMLKDKPAGSVQREAIEWTLDDHALSSPGNLSQIDTSLAGNYTNGLSIALTKEGLTWRRIAPGEPQTAYAIRKVRTDVYTIVDLNKQLGAFSSRIYIYRDAAGKIKSLTRKTFVNNDDIRVTENAYQRLP